MSFKAVSPNIWDRTLRGMSRNAQVVLFYVATCPARTGEGLYRLADVQITVDTGLPLDDVHAALDELEGVELVNYDRDAEVVLYRRGLVDAPLKHGKINRQTGERKRNSAMTPAVRKFCAVPDTPLKVAAYELACAYSPDFADEIRVADLYLARQLAARSVACEACGEQVHAVNRSMDGTDICDECVWGTEDEFKDDPEVDDALLSALANPSTR